MCTTKFRQLHLSTLYILSLCALLADTLLPYHLLFIAVLPKGITYVFLIHVNTEKHYLP